MSKHTCIYKTRKPVFDQRINLRKINVKKFAEEINAQDAFLSNWGLCNVYSDSHFHHTGARGKFFVEGIEKEQMNAIMEEVFGKESGQFGIFGNDAEHRKMAAAMIITLISDWKKNRKGEFTFL